MNPARGVEPKECAEDYCIRSHKRRAMLWAFMLFNETGKRNCFRKKFQIRYIKSFCGRYSLTCVDLSLLRCRDGSWLTCIIPNMLKSASKRARIFAVIPLIFRHLT